MTERADVLDGVPAFDTFISLVARNIQVLPEISLDDKGFSHRTQIFEDPGSRPRVLFSKRALSDYKRRKDILDTALIKKSPELLSAGACLLLGKYLLLTNRFVGVGLIANAFTTISAEYMADDDIFEYMLQGVRDDSQAAVINFFLPLAHEIGHFEKAQALRPRDLVSGKFRDTYRINYEIIFPIIGELDYLSCQNDAQSPLFFRLLMEEVTSDWFSVTAVFSLIATRARNHEFHLMEIFGALIMFPLVSAFEETCHKEWRSTKFVQEILLATQCRYSILIDSMRAGAKYLSPKNGSEIDEAILEIERLYRESMQTIWNAAIQTRSLINELTPLSDVQVARYIREKTRSTQWLSLHAYLNGVLEDSKGYPLFENNHNALRGIFDRMVTFDTAIIKDEGIVLIPKRNDS